MPLFFTAHHTETFPTRFFYTHTAHTKLFIPKFYTLPWVCLPEPLLPVSAPSSLLTNPCRPRKSFSLFASTIMFSYITHKTQVAVVAVFFSVVLLIRIVPFVAAVITVIDIIRARYPIDSPRRIAFLWARASWQLSGSSVPFTLPVCYSPQLCIPSRLFATATVVVVVRFPGISLLLLLLLFG